MQSDLVHSTSLYNHYTHILQSDLAGLHSAVGRAPDSQFRGPGIDIRPGHILSFLLPLIQEGQLSVTGESMSTKYWFTA